MYDVLGFCASEQLFLWLQVWQHCDCMRLDTEVEHYLCELCDPRPIDRVGVTVFEAPSFYTYVISNQHTIQSYITVVFFLIAFAGGSHETAAKLRSGRLCLLHLPAERRAAATSR